MAKLYGILIISVFLILEILFNPNFCLAQQHRLDEMMPDESEDLQSNVDGLGGGPDGLVEDLIVGKKSLEGDQVSSPKLSNCTSEIMTKLALAPSKSITQVTWSTVVNSHVFDPIKNQLTMVVDVILSWPIAGDENSDSCRNVDAVVIEPASLIWTPRFVFLNNLDTQSNLLPSDAWEKWPAVVHLDKGLVTWHFASRFTVSCSFLIDDPTTPMAHCPVKIAGVSSSGLLLETLLGRPTAGDALRNSPAFIFKTGEISVLTADDNSKLIRIDASAANDVPALVLLVKLDLGSNGGTGNFASNLLHNSFRIMRVRILSLQTETTEEEPTNQNTFIWPPRLVVNTGNFYCLLTFIGSFLVFLLSSVSITLVILSWYERQVSESLKAKQSVNFNHHSTTTTSPPSYTEVLKTGLQRPSIILTSGEDEDDQPILLLDTKE